MSRILVATIKFARLRIVATCYALVFVGNAAVGPIGGRTVLGLGLIVAVNVHANSINDWSDREIDRINLPDAGDRPLVTGDVSQRQFWLLHGLSAVAALALSPVYGYRVWWLTLAVLVIDYAYSLPPLRLTNRPLLSPLLLAVGYTGYSLAVGVGAAGPSPDYPWSLAGALSLGFVARLLLKDFRDTVGDRQHGKHTFLIRFGATATVLASGLCATGAAVWLAALSRWSPGVITFLVLATGLAIAALKRLPGSEPSRQQRLVRMIARAANYSIVVILAHLLGQQQPGLTPAEQQLIPAVTASMLVLLLGAHQLRETSSDEPGSASTTPSGATGRGHPLREAGRDEPAN